MTAYVPKGKTVAKVKVEVRAGVWVARSTGTRDPQTVKRIGACCTRSAATGRARDTAGQHYSEGVGDAGGERHS